MDGHNSATNTYLSSPLKQGETMESITLSQALDSPDKNYNHLNNNILLSYPIASPNINTH